MSGLDINSTYQKDVFVSYIAKYHGVSRLYFTAPIYLFPFVVKSVEAVQVIKGAIVIAASEHIHLVLMDS